MAGSLQFDFEQDWCDVLRAELASLGDVPPAGTHRELAIRLFTARMRRVSATSRTVHTAIGLQVPSDHSAGFADLKRKLEDGTDVTPHLSILIENPNSTDALLSDWAIHHFHLGTTPHATRPAFVSRTGPVVLALIGPDVAYIVDIAPHDFADQRYLQIIEQNWPSLLERVRVMGTPQAAVSNADVKQLRKAGVNTIISVGSGAIAPLGGGLTTGGSPVAATQYAISGMRALRALRDDVVTRSSAIIALLEADGARPSDIVLRAVFVTSEVRAVDQTSGVVVAAALFPQLP